MGSSGAPCAEKTFTYSIRGSAGALSFYLCFTINTWLLSEPEDFLYHLYSCENLKCTHKPYNITVEMTGNNGAVVPDAAISASFAMEGNGGIAGVGNGNPTDIRSVQQSGCTTFRGRCLIILR